VTVCVVRQFEELCAEKLIIPYSEVSLIRKTTNQRDDKLSYCRKRAAIKALNFTKPVESCIMF